jgi:hypothetical protein
MGLQVIYVTPLVVDQGLFLRLSRTFCEVDIDPDHSTMIVWVLDDRGTDARFVQSSDNASEAFVLNNPSNVPKGVFEMPAIVAPDGDLIWLHDQHKHQGSKCSPEYTLRVMWNGKVWESPHGKSESTDWRTKDPVIINR